MRIQFLIPGEPVGKGRPRFTKAGCAYTPEKTVQYEKMVRYAYINTVRTQQGSTMFADKVPVKATIYAFFKIPASWSKKKAAQAKNGELLPCVKPDADNIAKAILDALNGLAYKDDSVITECTVIKKYSEVGHVTVLLEEVV